MTDDGIVKVLVPTGNGGNALEVPSGTILTSGVRPQAFPLVASGFAAEFMALAGDTMPRLHIKSNVKSCDFGDIGAWDESTDKTTGSTTEKNTSGKEQKIVILHNDGTKQNHVIRDGGSVTVSETGGTYIVREGPKEEK
jgi:hypothetical protein